MIGTWRLDEDGVKRRWNGRKIERGVYCLVTQIIKGVRRKFQCFDVGRLEDDWWIVEWWWVGQVSPSHGQQMASSIWGRVANFQPLMLGFVLCKKIFFRFRQYKIPKFYRFPSNLQNGFEEFYESFYVFILIIYNPNLFN